MDKKDQLKEAAAAQAKAVREAAAAQAVVVKDAAAAQAKVVLSDMWHAVLHDRIVQLMLLILVLSIACGDVPGVKEFLYPFSMFKTMIHESGHALAARLTGGHVSSIALNPTPDMYGVTMIRGGIPWVTNPAGYMGLAIFGALLIWWGRKVEGARFVLQSIGTALLAVTLFYGSGTVPNFLLMLFISCVILLIASKAPDRFCHFFLIFLAVQVSLTAIISLKDVILAGALGATSLGDASAMESLTGIPAIVWATSWALFSLVAFLFAFWIAYRPAPTAKLAAASSAGAVALSAAPDLSAVPDRSAAPQSGAANTSATESGGGAKISMPQSVEAEPLPGASVKPDKAAADES